jgi:hypothetical protein
MQCCADAELSSHRNKFFAVTRYWRGRYDLFSDAEALDVLWNFIGNWTAIIPLTEFVLEVFEYCKVAPMFSV